MDTLPEPFQFIALASNSQHRVVALGMADGTPFPLEEDAQAFCDAYTARYPGLDCIVLPLIPTALETPA